MGNFDTITWQALTALLTLAGLAGTVAFWRLRGTVAGLRMLALTLLPAAAYLTGTLRLLWEVGDAVVSWAVHLTFSPATWLGVVLAGVAVALLVLAGWLRRRGTGVSRRAQQVGPSTAAGRKAVESGAASKHAAPASDADEDMADIEAILKRHGIS